MIFAIPILIAVTVFVLWALVKMTLNALSLFVGVSVALHALANGHGSTAALLQGGLAALAVVLLAQWVFVHSGSQCVKLLFAVAFAVPAAVAAYHVVRGLAVLVMPDTMGTASVAMIVAIFTGWQAWAGVAAKGQGRFA